MERSLVEAIPFQFPVRVKVTYKGRQLGTTRSAGSLHDEGDKQKWRPASRGARDLSIVAGAVETAHADSKWQTRGATVTERHETIILLASAGDLSLVICDLHKFLQLR